MKWVIHIAVGVLFAVVFFGAIEHFLHLGFWSSLALAALGGLGTAAGSTLEFAKKIFDLRKGYREDREAQLSKKSRIYTPSAEEVKE